jgi:hypothetical protein
METCIQQNIERTSQAPRIGPLSVLVENQFYEKMSKCTFGREEVEYFGHIILKEGVKVDPKF